MTLTDQCLSFLRHPADETVDQVVERGLRWLQSLLENGDVSPLFDSRPGTKTHELELARRLLGVRRARSVLEVSRRRAGWVLEADLRSVERALGAPLPPSLRRFWTLLGGDGGLREAIQSFTRLHLVTAKSWLKQPQRVRPKTSGTAWDPVLRGGSNAAHELDGDYGGWFAAADPMHQLRRGGDWRKLTVTTPVMLDPAFRPTIVRLGRRDDDWRYTVTALRDADGESPVFSGGDDFQTFSTKLGDSCAQWLAAELDETLRAVRLQAEALPELLVPRPSPAIAPARFPL